MKPLIVVIVVAALATGTVVWAGTHDTYYSWGQDHWPGTNQMQMVGQTPMAGQAASESQTYATCSCGRRRCSHWYGWLIRGDQADGYTGCATASNACFGSHRCW